MVQIFAVVEAESLPASAGIFGAQAGSTKREREATRRAAENSSTNVLATSS